MTPTPTERIVLFPEPLHHGHAGRRAAAVVCLSAAVGAAGWMLARDTVLRRWRPVGTASAASAVSAVVSRAAGSVASSVANDAAERITSSVAKPSASVAKPSASSGDESRMPSFISAPRPPAPPVDAGVNAYADANYDSATVLLRGALKAMGTDSARKGQRVRALTFLGAAELERGHRDSATAAYRQLLTLDPREAPDSAVFGKPVLDFYQQLRSRQRGVARIATTSGGVALTIIALTPHRLSVGVGRAGASAAFQLFSGLVSDSLVVTWNGAIPGGGSEAPGAYDLVLVATPSDGSAPKTVRFPVLLERDGSGTLHARVPASLPPPDDRLGGDTR
ncbi:MAG TPA: hypothetical protein VF483_08495 [Gemmatimonadaceae bacterium]